MGRRECCFPANWTRVIGLGCYLVIVLVTVGIYTEISHFWLPYGGFSGHLFAGEIPLLATLVILCVPVSTNRGWLRLVWSATTAIVLIGVLYAGHDGYYAVLNRVPGASDIGNILLLGDFGGWPVIAVGLVLLLAAGTWTGLLISESVGSQRPMRYLSLMSIRLLLGLAVVWSLPWYVTKIYQETVWSDMRSLRMNGRLISFVYRGVLEARNTQKLTADAGRIQSIPSPFRPGRLSVAAPKTTSTRQPRVRNSSASMKSGAAP